MVLLLLTTLTLAAVSPEQVDAALAANEYEKAEALARTWTQEKPAESAPWMKLSMALHGQRKFDEALKALDEAKQRGAPPIWLLLREVRARAQQGKLDRAFELLEVALTRGFANQALLESDPEFAPLRADKRYPALAEKLDRAANPCKYQPQSRRFDFWIGEWDVTVAGNVVGHSKVEQILNGCVLLENWTSLGGSSGKSFNLYDMHQKRWRQTWVDAAGQITDYAGDFNAKGELVFEGRLYQPKEQPVRMTFTKLSDDQVRQYMETSSDGGKSWQSAFDGLYTRRR